MHKFLIAAAATLAVATVAPAMAKTAKPAPAATAKVAEDKGVTANKNTKLCINYKVTGSRLPRKTCMTRQEWIAQEGFDPSVEG